MYRLQDYCERLMFIDPVEYGRRAEELLWRKVYYDIIQLMKHNKKVGALHWIHNHFVKKTTLTETFSQFLCCHLITIQDRPNKVYAMLKLRTFCVHFE